jgi:hypothetical protein
MARRQPEKQLMKYLTQICSTLAPHAHIADALEFIFALSAVFLFPFLALSPLSSHPFFLCFCRCVRVAVLLPQFGFAFIALFFLVVSLPLSSLTQSLQPLECIAPSQLFLQGDAEIEVRKASGQAFIFYIFEFD